MSSPYFRPVCFLLCASLFLIHPIQSNSQERNEPQLVRLGYAHGEVIFSPGKNGKPDLGAEWLQASEGLTLEDGYSLATEDGRAIVEFENGSLVYLAEHSVLQFQKLQFKNGATDSRLELLTGTATIAHVSNGRDQLVLDTPTAKLTQRSTQTLRVDSTLNGTIVHAVDSLVPINETSRHSKSELKPGDAVAYIEGFRFPLKGPMGQPANDSWDNWVNAQQLERAADIQKGLQESGLKEPIPGLADLVRNGHFFDCPPYGKCWEPNLPQTESALPSIQQPPISTAQAAASPPGPQNFVINRTLLSRCPMQTWMYSVGRPSRPGVLNANEPEETFRVSSFPWSGCFAGTWLVDSCYSPVGLTVFGSFLGFDLLTPGALGGYCPGRLVYVVGHRHRHHPPICRVHTPHGQGFVPQHPLDRRGKPPINAKTGVFVLALQKNNVEARFAHGPAKAPLWGMDVPKTFGASKNLLVTSAKSTTPPAIEGHMIQMVSSPAELAKAIQASQREENSIRYDYKSKGFVASRSLAPGLPHNNVVAKSAGAPVVVARVGSHGASGGVTGHGNGSWSGGGHGSSGSSGGGGSHSSGSSGGNGGGGHSGGASASSSGGGGGSSAGGGSHH